MSVNHPRTIAATACPAHAMPILLSLACCWLAVPVQAQPWTYIEVDDSRQKWGDWAKPEWLRYFGLDQGDINGDQRPDIVSGRYVYLNRGAALDVPWTRVDLGLNTDAMLRVDVDGDPFADLIATSLPRVYWLESTNRSATDWTAKEIARVKETGHVNGQGYRVADLIAGGKPEIILAGGGGLFLIEIPEQVGDGPWKTTPLVECSDEGFAVGDIDRDGDLDIAAANLVDGEPRTLFWWEQSGEDVPSGVKHPIHHSAHPIDRIQVADLNGDRRSDIVYSEERYPGKEPDAHLVWLQAPANPRTEDWIAHRLITQYSMNNLDVADIDDDGDVDIVTSEHKGPDLKLQLFRNDGRGRFALIEIDRGKEMHLGAQLADLDGDGDLDIFGHAWDNYQYLHLWRNDRIR